MSLGFRGRSFSIARCHISKVRATHIPHGVNAEPIHATAFLMFLPVVFVSPIVFCFFAYSFTCGSKLSRIYVCHEDFISSFIITHHKHHYVYMSEFHCFNASLFIILSSLLYLHLKSQLFCWLLAHFSTSCEYIYRLNSRTTTTTNKNGHKIHTYTQIVSP